MTLESQSCLKQKTKQNKKTVLKERKIVKFDFSKNKNFWSSKDIIKELKSTRVTLGEKTCSL